MSFSTSGASPMERASGCHRRSSRLKRKPLADITNAAAASASLKTLGPKPGPLRDAVSSISATRSNSSIGSSDPEKRRHPLIPLSSPRAEDISTGSVANAVNHCKASHSKLSLCSAKEKRKYKGKALAAAASLSCPPIKRTKRTGSTLSLEDSTIPLPDAHVDPCKNIKKRPCHTEAKDDGTSGAKHMLSQDFIDQQRAYFAEIDAFELPEEVVSESDLE